MNSTFKATKAKNISKMHSALLCTAALGAVFVPVAAFATDGLVNPVANIGNITVTSTATSQTISALNDDKVRVTATSGDTSAGFDQNFVQKSANSVMLVNITGGAPTLFNGNMHANGQVWYINPNGMTFGSTANVDVGSLLVSTANISDNNFLNPTVSANSTHYEFDQAGNPDAAIVIKGGAKIYAHYADGSADVLFDETGGQLGSTGTTVVNSTGDLDAKNLFNWTVSPGSSVDVLGVDGANPYGYGGGVATNPAHSQFIDLDGTANNHTVTPGVLTTKNAFDAPAGNYTITYDAAGNNRNSSPDGIKVNVIDASTNAVLATGTSVFSATQGWTTVNLNFNLAQSENIKIQVVGVPFNLPAGNVADNMGAQLGAFKLAYTAAQNSYITLMAPVIKQEAGSKVGTAAGGKINYAAGSTFGVNSAFNKSASSVKINDPSRGQAIVDGVPVNGAVQIDPNAVLYVAFNHGNAPVGDITIQAKVTQGAFNAFYDGNSDNDTNRVAIHPTGNPYGYYVTSDIINISPDAKIHSPGRHFDSSQQVADSTDNGELTGHHGHASRLNIHEDVVPGDAYFPPSSADVNAPTQEIAPIDRPLISFRDSALANNFKETRTGSVNGDVVVSEQNISGGSSANNGTTPVNVNTNDLGALEPAAGGDNQGGAAANGNTNEGAVCANEQLANPLPQATNKCYKTNGSI